MSVVNSDSQSESVDFEMNSGTTLSFSLDTLMENSLGLYSMVRFLIDSKHGSVSTIKENDLGLYAELVKKIANPAYLPVNPESMQAIMSLDYFWKPFRCRRKMKICSTEDKVTFSEYGIGSGIGKIIHQDLRTEFCTLANPFVTITSMTFTFHSKIKNWCFNYHYKEEPPISDYQYREAAPNVITLTLRQRNWNDDKQDQHFHFMSGYLLNEKLTWNPYEIVVGNCSSVARSIVVSVHYENEGMLYLKDQPMNQKGVNCCNSICTIERCLVVDCEYSII